MMTATPKRFLSSLVLALLAAACVGHAVTLVEWGEPDPDNNPASKTIVSGAVNFDTNPATTYSTASVALAAGYYDYTDASLPDKSEEFYAAATNYQGNQIQNNNSYDRIRITQANGTGLDEWEAMFVWTSFFVGLGSDSLETLS